MVGSLEVHAEFPAFQSLRLQLGISLRHHGEDHEGAVEFVDRGKAESAVGRRTQGKVAIHLQSCTGTPGNFPVGPVGIAVVANDRAIVSERAVEAILDSVAVCAQPTCQRDRSVIPVMIHEQAQVGVLAAGKAVLGEVAREG